MKNQIILLAGALLILASCSKSNPANPDNPGAGSNTLKFKVDGTMKTCDNDISGSRLKSNGYLRFSGHFSGGQLTVISPNAPASGTFDLKADVGSTMMLKIDGKSYSLRNTPSADAKSSGTATIISMQGGAGSSEYPTLNFNASLYSSDGSDSVIVTEGYLEIKK